MMELPSFKKVILLIVIAISFYILYCLIQRRQELMNMDDAPDVVEEGFAENMATIMPMEKMDAPLKEYLVFASWNSCATSDHNVSLDQLEKVAKNGCRFLDFEVYNIDGKPEVGFSTSGFVATDHVQELDSDTLDFLDVCNKLAMLKAPNNTDPLFLHFRLKSRNPNMLEHMANAFVSSGLSNRLYDGEVTKNTKLGDLKNKVVIMVDKTYVPDIKKNACGSSCQNDLRKMINIYSNTSDMPSMKVEYQLQQQQATPLTKGDDDLSTNVKKWKMVTHDFGSQYEDKNQNELRTLVTQYSVQVVPYKFYYNDRALGQYKNFFSDNGKRAFMRMSVAMDALIHATEED